MAIYHLTTKTFSRGKGQSAIAAAAYRSGDRLRDEATGDEKFYGSGADRIEFAGMFAPSNAPEWAHDRNEFWNRAEQREGRSDARLAREIEVALPHELTEEQRLFLVKDFVREQFVRKGYVADVAIHAPYGWSDGRNHHAHILISERRIGPEGFAAMKDPAMNSKAQLESWREDWAHLANRHLARHGHETRIDHRSLEAQGIEREAGIHIGAAAAEIERRGGQSDRAEELAGIRQRNSERVEVKAELTAIDREIAQLEKEQAQAAHQQAEAERQRDAAGAREAERSLADKIGRGEQVAAQTGNDRQAAEENLRRAAEQDERTRATPAGKAFEENARAEAGGIRQERREAARDQEAWGGSNPGGQAKEGRPREEGGLHVVDGVTGAATKLADFVIDLLASSPAEPAKKGDVRSFVTDPEARKQQQLARAAAMDATQRDREAIENIRRDMQAGKGLGASDIRNLTREHQEQIRRFGDDGMRQMVDDARKYAKQYWQGRERERD